MLRDVTLYPFQSEAAQRAVERQQMLLAITMGGGKTVISIAALEEMIEDGTITRAVIVVPSMLKYQWQREIMRFTNHYALVVDGTPGQRKLLYQAAQFYHYVIINYEAVVNDWEIVRFLPFDAVVIDEATYIKGFRSKRTRAVKALGRKKSVRMALTGQPIENKPEDLFSIMEFVDPDVLGDFASFDRTFIVRDYYGKPQRYRNLPILRNRMSEAMVRKSREDIADQLPRVVNSMIPVTLTRPEARLYDIIAGRLIERMTEAMNTYGPRFDIGMAYGRSDENNAMLREQGEIMTMILALRHVCDDAQLLHDSAMHYAARPKDAEGNVLNGTGSAFAYELYEEGLLDKLPESTKMKELIELLERLLEESTDSKIVVFSTFKGALRRMKERTAHLSQSVIFDGDMSAKEKDAAKMKFQNDPDCRLFFSSDAGGYGVNLSEANYLISFDLPWSTGKFEQRESRIIRLSTEFEHVTLISMVVRGSVEQRMYDMLEQKKGVADAFIDGGYDNKGRFEMTLSSLLSFLSEHSP